MSSEAVTQIADITKTVMLQAFTLDKCFSNLKDIQELIRGGMSSASAETLQGHVLTVCGTAAAAQQAAVELYKAPRIPPRAPNPRAD